MKQEHILYIAIGIVIGGSLIYVYLNNKKQTPLNVISNKAPTPYCNISEHQKEVKEGIALPPNFGQPGIGG